MWLDRAIKWLLPKEQHFFDLLERAASCARRSGEQFVLFCSEKSPSARLAIIEKIRMLEQEGDHVMAEVYDALNKTFVTPLDRGDIYHLSSRLEEVSDSICETALQVVVHAIEELPLGSEAFAQLIARACEELEQAMPLLRNMKNPELIRRRCKNVSSFDDQGSELFRQHTAQMFRTESDAIHLLKHKEFLEGLEHILHSCKQVGLSIENVVIKNA